MAVNYEIFREQFPKYQLNGLACKDGVVQHVDEDELTTIGKSADEVYYRLWRRLKVGMTLDECFVIWEDLCDQIWEYSRWHSFLEWTPSPKEWWTGTDGRPYHVKNGVVCRLGFEEERFHSPCNVSAGKVFEFLQPGMSLERAREFLSTNTRGAKRWRRIYEFKPVTRHQQREVKPVTATTKSGYDRKRCPPLISTTQVDVRILYPENDRLHTRPDQVQVVLYALTGVWEMCADGYKRISPQVKQHVNDYFRFARRQMLTNKELRMDKELLSQLKPRALRVTCDCCIECDFDVRRENDGKELG